MFEQIGLTTIVVTLGSAVLTNAVQASPVIEDREFKRSPVTQNLPLPKVSSDDYQWSNSPQNSTTQELKNSGVTTFEPINLGQNNQQQTTEQFPDPLAEVNGVKDLRDVSPTDWSYEALVNLTDRYNCLVGFPNKTYRGYQKVSRLEFAAGLNACLDKIELGIGNSQDVSAEDIDTLLKLMQQFQAELAILRGKTDGLTARTTELELTQFSTTTKLQGEAVFGLSGQVSGENSANTVFGDRLRLDLNTSFSGSDLLFTRLAAGNFTNLDPENSSFEGVLSFDQPGDNNLELEVLYYSFPVTDNLEILVGTTGVEADDFVNTVNFLDGDGSSGAISLFGTRNSIYFAPGDAGIGINYKIGDRLEISGGYLSSLANDPDQGGLFEEPFSAIAQVFFTPVKDLDIAFTYVRGRNQSDSGTGSQNANIQSLTTNNAFGGDIFADGIPTVSNSYGLDLSWAISDRLVIGGWGTLSQVSTLATFGDTGDRGRQNIWSTALTIALPDLGKEGSVAGLIVGLEPTVTRSTIEGLDADEDLSLHVEAFYQYKVNNNIAITPGVVWISAPDNNQANEDLVIGTIRTTFSF